jgi:hypothetical protein
VGFDVVPYVGTSSSADARDGTRHVALNLFGGYGSGLVGVEVGSLFNVETSHMCGAQVGGLLNVVTGPVRGVQAAGLVGVGGAFEGVQWSGLLNVSRSFSGAQVTGLVNVAAAGLRGFQGSGLVNVAAGDVGGAQIGGLVNVASGDVAGTQLSGLVNVAGGDVRGVQVGLVNVADKSDFSLGLVSVNTKGRTHLDLWSELEVGLLATAVKHGGDHWHGLYGVATRLTDPGLVGFAGIGGHVRFLEWLYLDVDAIAYLLPSFRDWDRSSTLLQARSVLGFNVIEQLAIYAGPSFNALVRPATSDDFSPGYAMQRSTEDRSSVPLWPGATLGIQGLAE